MSGLRRETHFRQTAGTYAEAAPHTYALNTDLAPATSGKVTSWTERNGRQFGWSAQASGSNYNTPNDARVSGRNSSTTGSILFRDKSPDGPGRYLVWLGFGGLTTTVSSGYDLKDETGATVYTGKDPISIPTGQLMDASGALMSITDFLASNGGLAGGTPVEINSADGIIQLARRTGTGAIYPVFMAYQLQDDPLQPVVVNGEGDRAPLTQVFSHEPAGKQVGTLRSPLGLQNFSLIGPIATYFAIETRFGLPRLVTTGTRLPANANLAGSMIRQTPATGSPYDTPFVPTIVSAAGRPVGTDRWGLITSQSWNRYKRVMDKMAAERWAGYTGQAFAQDLTADSPAALTAAVASITPDGTSWYRVRLQNGNWNVSANMIANKNFGSGGLLIEPDNGHDPVVSTGWVNFNAVRGVHWRNTILVPLNGLYCFSGGNFSTPYMRVIFEGNRIGYKFLPPPYDTSQWTTWQSFCSFEFVEQCILRKNIVYGISNFSILMGGRWMISEENDFQHFIRDVHAWGTAYRFNTPRNVFADNETYAIIQDNTYRNRLGVYTGLSGAATPHGDFLQIRRTGGRAYPYTSRPNGNGSATWAVGDQAINLSENRIYVVTGTTDANGATPGVGGPDAPTGTGSSITTGGVIFAFDQDYTLATRMNIILKNNTCQTNGKQVNLDGNATENLQFLINSNGGFGNVHEVTSLWNICMSTNTRGLDGGSDGDIRSEFDTFGNAGSAPLAPDQPCIYGAKINVNRSIIGSLTTGLNGKGIVVYGTALTGGGNDDNAEVIDWKSSAAAGQRPGDKLKGIFTQNPNTGAWGFDVNEDGTDTQEVFRSNLSKMLHPKTGNFGAKQRELHEFVIADSAGRSRKVVLPVAP